jgi:hypothetical protein
MNGKKLFTAKMEQIDNLKAKEAINALKQVEIDNEIKRRKRIEATNKCNVKRYASLKVQKELEEENKALKEDNERLEKEVAELKLLKGFKESKQIKEIKDDHKGGIFDDYHDDDYVPEYEDLDNEEMYNDEITRLLIMIGNQIGFKGDAIILYKDILRKNGLKQAKKYPYAERREKEYKKIIDALNRELRG